MRAYQHRLVHYLSEIEINKNGSECSLEDEDDPKDVKREAIIAQKSKNRMDQ